MGPDTCSDTGACKGRERAIGEDLRDTRPHFIPFPIRPCDFLVIDASGYPLRFCEMMAVCCCLQRSRHRASGRTGLYIC